ncbi:DUF4012 domain-containing protein [Demequina rhizosphaerae]|uniref:DUF4012 domain-containing protein n=1 Tax=Demequina rhizosphaerae TaxID=1638985 RepID=UPI000784F5D8|nr:DUF4012 domain-containing protein [Demequina rhizosphaerae]
MAGDDAAGDVGGARPRRRGRRWVLLTLGIVLVAAGVLLALLTYDAYRLSTAAAAVDEHAEAAEQALSDADPEALRREVAQVEEAARTFDAATHGPHWWLAARLPWLRNQAVPLATAGEAVGAVADDALAALAGQDDLAAFEVPSFEDGRVDPYVLEEYREPLAVASETLQTEVAALAAVDTSRSWAPIEELVSGLERQLTTLGGLVNGAHATAELLPSMLGGEGERHFLVMVQNNAEPRSTGGLPGAFFELTVDDGRMRLGRFAAARDLVDDAGRVAITEDEARIFGDLMSTYPHDANLTPEFPRTVEIIVDFWELKFGERPDAVVSIDPVALGWMLEGSEPLEAGGLEIAGENLAQIMLNQAYYLYEDPYEQDEFFARTAKQLFGRIVSGQAATLAGVERAIDAHRFLLWSADATEEDLLASTDVGGAFLEAEDTLGVFLNDGSGSKIGYFIGSDVTVTDYRCVDGSVAAATVDVELRHGYDGDVQDLPDYLVGIPQYVPRGEFHVNVLVYPPAGMELVGATRDGEDTAVVQDTHDGRAMSQKRIELKPGEQVNLVYELRATEGGLDLPGIVMTPGPRPNQPQLVLADAEGC